MSVFVGREAEMAQLRAGLERAVDHRGGMFLLRGEPGIGKTRLVEEIVDDAGRRGAAVFWGQCTQAEGAPPYWPWVQILRSLLRDLGPGEFGRLAGPDLAQILQIVPELRVHFPDVDSISIEDDATRFRTYDAVTQLLLNAATTRPIVFVLEDLHWADVPSLLLLQLLAGSVTHSALMVIGTYRDRELPADHPLRAQLGDFVRKGETVEIAVGGLADKEVASLLRALTAFEPADDMVKRLQSQTAGNPFFLKELARTLGEDTDEDSPSKAARTFGVVPQGVGAVLRRRMEALSTDCQRMLEVAAVAGQALDVELLVTAAETRRPQLLDLFDEAIANGVVSRRGGNYAFAHGLVRDTVYGGISTVRRCELHARVARVLEQRPSEEFTVPLAQLAHHFVEASVADESMRSKALEYAVASGRRAHAELAYEEAARLFESALGVDGPLIPAERAAILLDLGHARYLAGDVSKAIEAAQDVSRLAEQLGDSELLARAALVVRGVGGPGVNEEVKDLCDAALRRPSEDVSMRIQVLSQLTVVLMQMSDLEAEQHAVEYSAQAMRLAQDAVDPDAVFAAIHARQMARSGPDGVDERLQLAEQTLVLARESGRRSLAQWGHGWRADALAQLGRIDEAEIELSTLTSLADELRELLLRWRTLQARSWVAILRGKFDEARTLAEEAHLLGRKGNQPIGEFAHWLHAMVLSAFVGQQQATIDGVQDYLIQRPEFVAPLLVARVSALVATGRLEEARLILRFFAAGGPNSVRPLMGWLPGMAGITVAITAVGDAEQSAIAYEALLPYAHHNVATGAGLAGLWGSVSHYLGMLAGTMDQWEDAIQHYEDAMAFETRMGAPPFVACTKVLYAELLTRRAGEADLRYARRLAMDGLALSRELGMKPWEDRASKLVSALAARGVADHPLSSRELEVAKLIADGLSNRAIAESLHLSERTAESHVKNICDKLGFNSRSQVAAWFATRKRA